MANFATVQTRLNSLNRAAGLLEQLRTIYRQTQFAKQAIADYQANTDPVFRQAIDDIFPASERSQLAAMLTQLNNIDSNWTANHTNLLNPPAGP